MNISVHHPLARYLRVLIDGEDVTRWTFATNEADGTVSVFRRTADNKFMLDVMGYPLAEIRICKFELLLRDDAPEAARLAWEAYRRDPSGGLNYEEAE